MGGEGVGGGGEPFCEEGGDFPDDLARGQWMWWCGLLVCLSGRAKQKGVEVNRGEGSWLDAPAPVVPPARLDERTPGDCVMVKSRPAMVSSSVVALESMKPRFWEGKSCANKSNVST